MKVEYVVTGNVISLVTSQRAGFPKFSTHYVKKGENKRSELLISASYDRSEIFIITDSNIYKSNS